MPRKAKDEELIKNANKSRKTSTTKKDTNKKSDITKKSNTTKKSTSVKKSAVTKKSNQKATTKNSSLSKKTTTAKKSATSKKNANTTKKSTRAKTSTQKSKVAKNLVVPTEYYDLPAIYDKTVVKVLAQTPFCLFVYWEISEKDRAKLQKQYGNGFFHDTKPYLVIINETMNYSFETEINDYANSWYIHIHDSDCKYTIKLIRKPINNEVNFPVSYIDIMSSNEIDSPNDHILFDRLGKTVFFRNVKTNIINEKDISSLSFISNIGRIYNIYDLYKEIYQNELNGNELGTKLSSSQFSSFSM